jgi:hypothetical protein
MEQFTNQIRVKIHERPWDACHAIEPDASDRKAQFGRDELPGIDVHHIFRVYPDKELSYDINLFIDRNLSTLYNLS